MPTNKDDTDFFDEIEEDVFGGDLKKTNKTKWFIIGIIAVMFAGLFIYIRFFLFRGGAKQFLSMVHKQSSKNVDTAKVLDSELPDSHNTEGQNIKLEDENMDIAKTSNIDKDIPEWDLKALYESISDPKIRSDIENMNSATGEVVKMIKESDLSHHGVLFEIISKLESISSTASKLMAFAVLNHSVDTHDPDVSKINSVIKQSVYRSSSETIIFENKLIESIKHHNLETIIEADVRLKPYKHFISRILDRQKHMLSEETEKYAIQSGIVTSAWSTLFDKVLSGTTFTFQEHKNITVSEIVSMMASNDRATRIGAATAFGEGLEKNSDTVTHIYNAIVREKIVDTSFRKFKEPISERNFSNDVEDEVVDILIKTVQQNYPQTSHRYYALKAKLLGLEQMHYSDRSAPMPFASHKNYSWAEAKEVVISSYAMFSPDFAKLAQDFFDENRIHGIVRKGKESGAFCLSPHSTRPFILLNFTGKKEDVTTLAHEVGHGIHGILAMKQTNFNATPPLTLAETASLFGEKITTNFLMHKTTSVLERAALLATAIERVLDGVNRQVAFVDFEKRVFANSKESDLTKEEISKIWMDVQHESLGKVFTFDENYKYYWTYISHFFHYPFYVYSYAFADLLVSSLFKIYQDKKVSDFESKYTKLLSLGGSENYKKILDEFGINPADPQFWQKGMDTLVEMIDEFEKLVSSEEFQKALSEMKKSE